MTTLMTMHVYPLGFVPIPFDCLDSQMAGPEDKMHVGSNIEGSQDVGSVEGQTVECFEDREGARSNVVGSDPSSSTARRQGRPLTRLPKKKRNKIPMVLAPTPKLRLPSGLNPSYRASDPGSGFPMSIHPRNPEPEPEQQRRYNSNKPVCSNHNDEW